MTDNEMDLSDLSRYVANALTQAYSEFRGCRVRVDAGDPGKVYVALREAKRQPDLGEAFAEEMTSVIDDVIEQSAIDADYSVALGAGHDDLVLQIEIRES